MCFRDPTYKHKDFDKKLGLIISGPNFQAFHNESAKVAVVALLLNCRIEIIVDRLAPKKSVGTMARVARCSQELHEDAFGEKRQP